MNNLLNINVNKHSSIQIGNMFFDPWKITNSNLKAEYIFITHTHYDHLDIASLKNITNNNTVFIAPPDAKPTLNKNFKDNKKLIVSPNEIFELENIKIETFPSYNLNKDFHKKEYNWVGYKVTVNEISYLVCGDTDITPELKKLKCDVLFVPIGGTYTMNANEASKLTNTIKPNLVIPIHYNDIVGSKEDEKTFLSNLNNSIKYKIYL